MRRRVHRDRARCGTAFRHRQGGRGCDRQPRDAGSRRSRSSPPGRGATARHGDRIPQKGRPMSPLEQPSGKPISRTYRRYLLRRVDECARSLMMWRDAGNGNLYREDFRSAATDRSGARRRRVATSLPFLRRDRRSARCFVRAVLGWNHILRAAVVRALRSALSPSDGRGCSLRRLCA